MLNRSLSSLKWLFIFCIFILSKGTISAQDENNCGTPDLSWSEYNLLRSNIGPIISGGGGVTYLPIWYNVVTPTSSTLGWLSEFRPLEMIETLNGYFSAPEIGIQFYLCGITYIHSDAWADLTINTESSALRTFAQSQNPDFDNVINIYLVSRIQLDNKIYSGYASPPGSGPGSIYISGVYDNNLAHEMGHFFSLPHTFAGGPTVTDSQHPEYAQYVQDNITLLVNSAPKNFSCYDTGDGFCDTNADPYKNPTSFCTFNSTCQELINCTPYPNDPLGVPYDPDPSLLMSYYLECSTRFSGEQMTQMRNVLMGHPAWSFLIDSNVPACQNLGNSSGQGFILRNCTGISPITPIEPMVNLTVPFYDESTPPIACGTPDAITNNAGRFLTNNCVYPYSGTGLLSVLPNVEHPDPLNGVTTVDLLQISSHILGIQSFESPFQLIAADANNSGSVTTFDIVEIRKLILGVYDLLPNNNSWRYIPQYCFDDLNFSNDFFDNGAIINPFNAVWINPDEINILPVPNLRTYGSGPIHQSPNVTSWMDHVSLNPNGTGVEKATSWSFWAVKVGDVNCSASIDAIQEEKPDKNFSVASHTLINTNQIFTININVTSSKLVSAWQLGIDFAEDSLQLIQVEAGNSGETFSLDNFGLLDENKGKIRALNFAENGIPKNLTGKTLFKVTLKALKPIGNIGDRFRLKNSVLPLIFFDESGEEIESIDLELNVNNSHLSFIGGNNLTTGFQPNKLALNVYPMPFETDINFQVSSDIEEDINISIFDNTGRLMCVKKESLSEGLNNIKIDLIKELRSGLYWYSVVSEGQRFFGKLIKQ